MNDHLKVLNAVLLCFALLFSTLTGQDDFSDDVVERSETQKRKINNVRQMLLLVQTAGANVIVDDTDMGAAADEDGKYVIDGIESGTSVTSYEKYDDLTLYADQKELNFELIYITVELSALEVLASRATEKTAAAYTDVGKDELALRLGSQDIPLVMNLVPKGLCNKSRRWRRR